MRYTVDYKYDPDADGYFFTITEYRKPQNIIVKNGYLRKINLEENGFQSVKEYILCYGLH